ncbi:MAG: hypothetical protein D8M59_14275 [Planctomycetes bacterium]|nr:hypothetical protein [Planctomycetota bacterium]NOG55498.1 hypothetical protein [Planctomycetota bacterium]
MNVSINLAGSKLAAGPINSTDAGRAGFTLPMPTVADEQEVWFQAVQYGIATNYIGTRFVKQ